MFGDDLRHISNHFGILIIFFMPLTSCSKSLPNLEGTDFSGDFQDCMFQIGFKATYYLNIQLCFSFHLQK